MSPLAIYNLYFFHFYSKLVLTMISHSALYPLSYLDESNHTFKNLLSTFFSNDKRVVLLNCCEGRSYNYSLSGVMP